MKICKLELTKKNEREREEETEKNSFLKYQDAEYLKKLP